MFLRVTTDSKFPLDDDICNIVMLPWKQMAFISHGKYISLMDLSLKRLQTWEIFDDTDSPGILTFDAGTGNLIAANGHHFNSRLPWLNSRFLIESILQPPLIPSSECSTLKKDDKMNNLTVLDRNSSGDLKIEKSVGLVKFDVPVDIAKYIIECSTEIPKQTDSTDNENHLKGNMTQYVDSLIKLVNDDSASWSQVVTLRTQLKDLEDFLLLILSTECASSHPEFRNILFYRLDQLRSYSASIITTDSAGNNIDNSNALPWYFCEIYRRRSFKDWPHKDYKWAYGDALADAGFHHTPQGYSSCEDRAMCFICKVVLVSWEPTDEPFSEHKRHSPNCPFINGQIVGNLPIRYTSAVEIAKLHPCKDKITVIGDSQFSRRFHVVSTESGHVAVYDKLNSCALHTHFRIMDYNEFGGALYKVTSLMTFDLVSPDNSNPRSCLLVAVVLVDLDDDSNILKKWPSILSFEIAHESTTNLDSQDSLGEYSDYSKANKIQDIHYSALGSSYADFSFSDEESGSECGTFYKNKTNAIKKHSSSHIPSFNDAVTRANFYGALGLPISMKIFMEKFESCKVELAQSSSTLVHQPVSDVHKVERKVFHGFKCPQHCTMKHLPAKQSIYHQHTFSFPASQDDGMCLFVSQMFLQGPVSNRVQLLAPLHLLVVLESEGKMTKSCLSIFKFRVSESDQMSIYPITQQESPMFTKTIPFTQLKRCEPEFLENHLPSKFVDWTFKPFASELINFHKKDVGIHQLWLPTDCTNGKDRFMESSDINLFQEVHSNMDSSMLQTLLYPLWFAINHEENQLFVVDSYSYLAGEDISTSACNIPHHFDNSLNENSNPDTKAVAPFKLTNYNFCSSLDVFLLVFDQKNIHFGHLTESGDSYEADSTTKASLMGDDVIETKEITMESLLAMQDLTLTEPFKSGLTGISGCHMDVNKYTAAFFNSVSSQEAFLLQTADESLMQDGSQWNIPMYSLSVTPSDTANIKKNYTDPKEFLRLVIRRRKPSGNAMNIMNGSQSTGCNSCLWTAERDSQDSRSLVVAWTDIVLPIRVARHRVPISHAEVIIKLRKSLEIHDATLILSLLKRQPLRASNNAGSSADSDPISLEQVDAPYMDDVDNPSNNSTSQKTGLLTSKELSDLNATLVAGPYFFLEENLDLSGTSVALTVVSPEMMNYDGDGQFLLHLRAIPKETCGSPMTSLLLNDNCMGLKVVESIFISFYQYRSHVHRSSGIRQRSAVLTSQNIVMKLHEYLSKCASNDATIFSDKSHLRQHRILLCLDVFYWISMLNLHAVKFQRELPQTLLQVFKTSLDIYLENFLLHGFRSVTRKFCVLMELLVRLELKLVTSNMRDSLDFSISLHHSILSCLMKLPEAESPLNVTAIFSLLQWLEHQLETCPATDLFTLDHRNQLRGETIKFKIGLLENLSMILKSLQNTQSQKFLNDCLKNNEIDPFYLGPWGSTNSRILPRISLSDVSDEHIAKDIANLITLTTEEAIFKSSILKSESLECSTQTFPSTLNEFLYKSFHSTNDPLGLEEVEVLPITCQKACEGTRFGVSYLSRGNKSSCFEKIPSAFREPIPQYWLVMNNIHAGAHTYIIGNFGMPVVLTDILLPSHRDLESVEIRVGMGPENQPICLASYKDISHRPLLLTDMHSRVTCQYIRISFVTSLKAASVNNWRAHLGMYFGYGAVANLASSKPLGAKEVLVDTHRYLHREHKEACQKLYLALRKSVSADEKSVEHLNEEVKSALLQCKILQNSYASFLNLMRKFNAIDWIFPERMKMKSSPSIEQMNYLINLCLQSLLHPREKGFHPVRNPLCINDLFLEDLELITKLKTPQACWKIQLHIYSNILFHGSASSQRLVSSLIARIFIFISGVNDVNMFALWSDWTDSILTKYEELTNKAFSENDISNTDRLFLFICYIQEKLCLTDLTSVVFECLINQLLACFMTPKDSSRVILKQPFRLLRVLDLLHNALYCVQLKKDMPSKNHKYSLLDGKKSRQNNEALFKPRIHTAKEVNSASIEQLQTFQKKIFSETSPNAKFTELSEQKIVLEVLETQRLIHLHQRMIATPVASNTSSTTGPQLRSTNVPYFTDVPNKRKWNMPSTSNCVPPKVENSGSPFLKKIQNVYNEASTSNTPSPMFASEASCIKSLRCLFGFLSQGVDSSVSADVYYQCCQTASLLYQRCPYVIPLQSLLTSAELLLWFQKIVFLQQRSRLDEFLYRATISLLAKFLSSHEEMDRASSLSNVSKPAVPPHSTAAAGSSSGDTKLKKNSKTVSLESNLGLMKSLHSFAVSDESIDSNDCIVEYLEHPVGISHPQEVTSIMDLDDISVDSSEDFGINSDWHLFSQTGKVPTEIIELDDSDDENVYDISGPSPYCPFEPVDAKDFSGVNLPSPVPWDPSTTPKKDSPMHPVCLEGNFSWRDLSFAPFVYKPSPSVSLNLIGWGNANNARLRRLVSHQLNSDWGQIQLNVPSKWCCIINAQNQKPKNSIESDFDDVIGSNRRFVADCLFEIFSSESVSLYLGKAMDFWIDLDAFSSEPTLTMTASKILLLLSFFSQTSIHNSNLLQSLPFDSCLRLLVLFGRQKQFHDNESFSSILESQELLDFLWLMCTNIQGCFQPIEKPQTCQLLLEFLKISESSIVTSRFVGILCSVLCRILETALHQQCYIDIVSVLVDQLIHCYTLHENTSLDLQMIHLVCQFSRKYMIFCLENINSSVSSYSSATSVQKLNSSEFCLPPIFLTFGRPPLSNMPNNPITKTVDHSGAICLATFFTLTRKLLRLGSQIVQLSNSSTQLPHKSSDLLSSRLISMKTPICTLVDILLDCQMQDHLLPALYASSDCTAFAHELIDSLKVMPDTVWPDEAMSLLVNICQNCSPEESLQLQVLIFSHLKELWNGKIFTRDLSAPFLIFYLWWLNDCVENQTNDKTGIFNFLHLGGIQWLSDYLLLPALECRLNQSKMSSCIGTSVQQALKSSKTSKRRAETPSTNDNANAPPWHKLTAMHQAKMSRYNNPNVCSNSSFPSHTSVPTFTPWNEEISHSLNQHFSISSWNYSKQTWVETALPEENLEIPTPEQTSTLSLHSHPLHSLSSSANYIDMINLDEIMDLGPPWLQQQQTFAFNHELAGTGPWKQRQLFRCKQNPPQILWTYEFVPQEKYVDLTLVSSHSSLLVNKIAFAFADESSLQYISVIFDHSSSNGSYLNRQGTAPVSVSANKVVHLQFTSRLCDRITLRFWRHPSKLNLRLSQLSVYGAAYDHCFLRNDSVPGLHSIILLNEVLKKVSPSDLDSLWKKGEELENVLASLCTLLASSTPTATTHASPYSYTSYATKSPASGLNESLKPSDSPTKTAEGKKSAALHSLSNECGSSVPIAVSPFRWVCALAHTMSLQSMSCFNLCLKKWFRHSSKNASSANPFKPFTTWESRLAYKICTDNKDGKVFERLRILLDAAKNELQQTQLRVTQQAQLWTLLSAVLWRCRDVALQLENNPIMNCTHEDPLIHWDEESIKNLLAIFPTVSMQLLDAYNSFLCALCAWKPHYFKLLCQWGGLEGVTLSPNNPTLLHKIVDSFPFVALSALSKDNVKSLLQSEILETICESLTCFCLAQFPFIRKELSIVSHPLFSCGMCSKESKRLQEMADSFSPNENSIALFCSPATLTCALKLLNNLCDIALMNTSIKHYLGVNERCFSLWVPLFIMTLLNDEFEALTYEPLAHLQIETIVEKYFSILCSGSQQNQIKFSLLLTAVLDAALNKKIWTKIPDFIRKIMLEIIMKKPTVEVILHCEDSPVPLLADGYMHTPSTVSTQSDLFSIKQTSLFQQHPANRLNACHGQTVSLQVPSDVTVFSILKNFNIPRWTTYMEYTQLSQKFGGTDAANPPPPLMIAIQTRQGDLALVTPNVSLNTLLLSTNLSSQLPSMSEESNNTVCDSVIHLYLIGTSPNFAENCTLPHLQFPLDVASGRMEDISPLHNMTSVGGLQSLSFALPLLYPKLQSLLLKSKKEKDCSKALLLSNMDEMHNSADIDISNDLLVSLKSNLSNLTSQLLSATSFLGLPTTNMPTVVPSQVATSSSLKAMQQPVVPYGPIHVSSIPQNMVSLQRRKHAPAVKNISLPELLIYSPVSFALFLQLPMFGKFMLNYNLDASRQMLRLLLGDSSITTSFATVNSSNSPGPSSTLKSNESAVDKDCLAIAEENNEKLTIFPFTVLQHLMNQYGLDSKLGQDIREKAAENGALSLCLRCLAVFSSQQRSQSRQQSLHHWSDDVESLIESVLLDVQLQLDLGMIDKQKTPAANNMGNLSMLDNDLVNIDIIPTMSDGVSYEEDKHYWAKGTGFGTGNVYSSWDAEDALKRQSLQEKQCAGLMDVLACILYPSYADEKKINTFLQQKDDFSPDMTCCIRSKLVVELYEQSSILSILEAYLRNDSVLDVSTRVPLYQSIIHLLCSIALSPSLCYLLNVTLVTHDVETNLPPNLIGLLEQMNNCVSTYMHRLKKIPAPSQEDRFKRKKALTRQPSIHRGFTRGGLSSRSRAGIQKEYFNNATEPSDSGLAKLAPQLVRTQQILACLKDYFERQSLLEFERLRIQQAESGNAVVENSSQSFPASASCVVAVNKDKQYCDTMKPEQFGFFRMLRVNDDGSVVFLVKHGYANQIRQNMGSSKQMPANSSKTASGNLHSSMPPPVTSNNVVSGQWLSFLPQGNPFVKVGPAGSIFGKKNDTSSVSTQVDGEHARRLAQETVTLSTSLPLSASSSVFVRCDEERLDLMKALIVGPSDTPYANGLFEFDIYFPPTYPKSPPGITLVTTGNSTVRFNPNLYNDGKVCLSILNTWHGRPEEKWNPKTSTLLQVLVSIQSLIMVPEPYFNEPGYERTRGTSIGNQASLDYDANIRQATVKWAMLEMLRNPPPAFAKVCQEHFRLKRDEIRKQLEDWISSRPPKTDKQKTGHVNQTSHALLVRHTADLLTEMNNKYAHNQSSAEDIATTSSSTVVAKESAAKSNDSVSDNSPENDPLL